MQSTAPTAAAARPFAVLILTRSGKCLVHRAVGDYAQNPILRVGPLCQLLTAFQEMHGRPENSFIVLHGCGVALVESHGVLVAVVSAPFDDAASTARLIGLQVLNAFGNAHGVEAQEIDAAYEEEARAAAEGYTVHSAVRDGAIAPEIGTLPPFASFADQYLSALLLGAPTDSLTEEVPPTSVGHLTPTRSRVPGIDDRDALAGSLAASGGAAAMSTPRKHGTDDASMAREAALVSPLHLSIESPRMDEAVNPGGGDAEGAREGELQAWPLRAVAPVAASSVPQLAPLKLRGTSRYVG